MVEEEYFDCFAIYLIKMKAQTEIVLVGKELNLWKFENRFQINNYEIKLNQLFVLV